jgi:hypothetical protein
MPPGWKIAGVGDFNGDGLSDVVWTTAAPGGPAFLWLNNGNNTVTGSLLSRYGSVPGQAYTGNFVQAATTNLATTPTPVSGYCGTAAAASASKPAANLCTTGTASTVTGSGPWAWTCAGANGGTAAQCEAALKPPPVSGACGAASGTYASSLPTTNLCNTGTASTVTGTGPWAWTCAGSNGGTAAQCNSATIKPPLIGLISMGAVAPTISNENASYDIPSSSLTDVTTERNAFDGTVINIPWAVIQPNQSTDFDTTAIDTALQNIRNYNLDSRTTVPLRAILRIWAAGSAPNWVKILDGPAISVYGLDPNPEQAYTIGHFWSANYKQAWQNLQSQLAAKYDSEPLIAQISNTSCTSADDEPNALARYYNQSLGISSIGNLHAAGYTDAAFETCMQDAYQDYIQWKTTRVNFTFGEIFLADNIGNYQQPIKDQAFTVNLIQQWRSILGARGVLANHNLNYPLESQENLVYAEIKTLGPQIEFQTHSPSGLDWPDTISEDVCLGSQSLEIWNSTNAGGYIDFPLATLMDWSNQLKTTTSNSLCPGGSGVTGSSN